MANRMVWGPLIIALIATAWLAYLLAPMSSIIMWSIILTVLFSDLNERFARKYKTRSRAALATVGVMILTAIVPFIFIALILSGQIIELARNSDSIVASFSQGTATAIASMPAGFQNWYQETAGGIEFSSEHLRKMIGPMLSYSLSVGTNVAVFVVSLLAVLYVSFFLMRDREKVLRFVSAGVPLNEEQKDFLSNRLANTMLATVRGVILVAVAQSLVAGLIYALLGIEFFAILTVLTFIGCLIPAIGSGLVWVPVAIGFFLTGDPVKGFIMLGSGMLVISMIDNVLRPRLIGEKAALPDFMIFLSSIGGMAAIGINGLFLGPIVSGFFIESWNVYTGLGRLQDEGEDAADASGGTLSGGDKAKAKAKLKAQASPKAKGKASPKAKGKASPKVKGKASPRAKGKASPKVKGKASPRAKGKSSPKGAA